MLREFFQAAGPWIRGETDAEELRKLGPTPSTKADLAFYPWLTRHGYHDVLSSIFSAVKVLIDSHDGPVWAELCDAFLADHHPSGPLLETMGEPFSTWLETHLHDTTFLDKVHGDGATANVVASLADYQYCQALARHATDGPGLCLNERVFVRRYPVDVVKLGRDPMAQKVSTHATVCIFRDLRDNTVKVFPPTVATMAVFAELLGQPRLGHLALPQEDVDKEARRLQGLGVYPVAS